MSEKQIELSKLISLANDIWRLEEKINNLNSKEEQEKLNISFSRIKKFI
jgi:hypothetical protein